MDVFDIHVDEMEPTEYMRRARMLGGLGEEAEGEEAEDEG